MPPEPLNSVESDSLPIPTIDWPMLTFPPINLWSLPAPTSSSAQGSTTCSNNNLPAAGGHPPPPHPSGAAFGGKEGASTG